MAEPGPIGVNSHSMADAGTFLHGIASTLGNGFIRMDAEIDAMTAYWDGPAATAFVAGWQEASAGAVQVLSSLEGMAELLGVQGSEFAEVDESLAGELADTEPQTSSLNI
ncbi:WXG100 family type VII secretion target [Nocardia flavorosea]|uniref:WXG100 family type VII secretion target n=1 Tax=Nocardia flavorosea TaxID=53429 RepID=UPI001895EEED|nr:WXG100 family type VII secretion target [Nocardia flavorosea]MBF6349008.1 WXG100 family type VII secretion target [Nocardia flavorosea]